nr:RHS repeat domain-containing protein [Snodgrassella alvi]
MKTKNSIQPSNRLKDFLFRVISYILMLAMALPQMAYARITGNIEQKISGVGNASVRLPNAEYTENTIDMRVKVLGGEVKLNRTWENGRWYLNPAWAELRFVLDPLDNSVKTIDRAGTLYQRSGTADLYTYKQVSIQKTDSGWRWSDQQGNWINYDSKGRPLAYGNASNVKVSFELDKEGRRTAIKDNNNELVYSLDYDNQDHLIKATDRSGRSVSYSWAGDKLTKVTDVMGNEWKYGYDKNGQLNSRTDPDGGVTKIDYVQSVKSFRVAMGSGMNGGGISQSTVVTTGAADHENKLARVGKITTKTGAVTVYNTEYNRVNKQYTITVNDPAGKKTVNVFDSNGRLLSESIDGSLTASYQHDTANNIVKYTDERGQVTTTQYNQAEYPLKVTYPNGSTKEYQYNQANKLVRKINAKGEITTFEYNADNQPTKITYAAGKPEQRIVKFEYDDLGQQTKAIISSGSEAISLQQSFDRYGNIASYTDGKGQQYRYSYNIQGQPTEIQNPLQQKWLLDYNAAGYNTKLTDPLNHTTNINTDALGRVIGITDAQGNKTSYSYQDIAKGRVVKATNALNQVITLQYDQFNRLTKTITPSGLVSEQSYDNEDRLIQYKDYNGNQLGYEYGAYGSNLAGLLTKVTYPTYSESYDYDNMGNAISVSQLLDNTAVQYLRSSYDQQGQIISQTDAAGRTSQSAYNALAQVTTDINALSGKTVYQYDLQGNITTLTDPNNNHYHFTYDQNNNLIKETRTLGNDVEYSYNNANQLIEQKQTNGNRVQYQYDGAGNISRQSYIAADKVDAEQTVSYQYDANNQLTDVQQSGETSSHFIYQRDVLGRIVQEDISYGNIKKTLKYSYDVDGNLASITYPDNSTVNYIYANNQLQKAVLPNGEEINWSNYQWNKPGKVTYPHAVQTNSYDALQRPVQIKLVSNDKTLLERNYSYDKVSNISHIQTEKGSSSYQYDQLDRLTQVKPESETTEQQAESYSYDAIGNRTGSAQQPGVWLYNKQNQLVKWGEGKQQTNLTYTPNGQLSTEENANKKLSYSYNAAERLSKVSNDVGELARYEYDPFGRRISKTVNGETTYYIYSSEGLIAELDQNGRMRIAYGWQPNSDWGTSPLWQANLSDGQTLKNAGYHYLITDHIGTPQLAINGVGEQSWKINSDVFGNSELDANNFITMNLRFPGQYYDAETGLSYNYYRYYDPKTGKYIQNDPIGIAGGINTYEYVGANPLIYTDPNGEIWQLALGAVGTGAGIGTGSIAAMLVGVGGITAIGWCVLSPECRKNVSDLYQNIERRITEADIENDKHPDEVRLEEVCQNHRYSFFDEPPGKDPCDNVRERIEYLKTRLIMRAWDLADHDKPTKTFEEQRKFNNHQNRFKRVNNILKSLIKFAKEMDCSDEKIDYKQQNTFSEKGWKSIIRNYERIPELNKIP